MASNLVANGVFSEGLNAWNLQGNVTLLTGALDRGACLQDRDSALEQTLTLSNADGDTQYRLRVRAKGNGWITIIANDTPNPHRLFFSCPQWTIREDYFYSNNTQCQIKLNSEDSGFLVDWVEVTPVGAT